VAETKLEHATGIGNAAPVTSSEETYAAPTGDDKSAVMPQQPDPLYQRMQSIGRAETWAEE